MRTNLACGLCLALGVLSMVEAAEQRTSFEATVTKQVGANYLVVTPHDYDPEKKYPLLLFLHGRGEQGDNLDLVQIHGPYKKVAELGLPFIIVAPQSPKDEWWDIDTLSELVDHLLEELPIDRDRVYVTGLSMGGSGTWQLIVRRPELFAAAVPICGWSAPSKAAKLGNLPVWVFHGAQDPVVNPGESREMVEAIQQAGGNVKYTEYPEAAHNSWTETYNNPELYEWLLDHRLSDRAE